MISPQGRAMLGRWSLRLCSAMISFLCGMNRGWPILVVDTLERGKEKCTKGKVR